MIETLPPFASCASWVHNILTTVMTNTVVDMSTDNAEWSDMQTKGHYFDQSQQRKTMKRAKHNAKV